jgi:hypothetical protein
VAVVRLNYIPTDRGRSYAVRSAKANVKYIQNRKGKDGQTVHRTLFGIDGAMERLDAYRMIDEAGEGSRFFRIKISPDPVKEDTNRDLSLWEITKQTIECAERELRKEVSWIAAVHDDHTPIRHVHVLAMVKGTKLPAPAMIQRATKAAIAQRKELDLAAQRDKQQQLEKEGAWELELERS